MPEAFAVLLVAAIIVGVLIAARIQARAPAVRDLQSEASQLDREIAWLVERLHRADQENWGNDMKEALRERYIEALRQRSSLPDRGAPTSHRA